MTTDLSHPPSAYRQRNLAETLAHELKQPIKLESLYHGVFNRYGLPPGWTMAEKDDENLLPSPRRKTAMVVLDTAESFAVYMTRHRDEHPTIWVKADFTQGRVSFVGILNDHGPGFEEQAWRDHRATFSPRFSEEWARWKSKSREHFSQADFASWIEDNVADIVESDGSPSGAQMLLMAINFEANQDRRFKSAIRLQNGGVDVTFVQDDDTQTLEKMKLFDRFSIGIPVFWGGDAYQIDARLRYRVRDGKLTFWYELIRPDRTLEAATRTVIEKIKTETGKPLFFGSPF